MNPRYHQQLQHTRARIARGRRRMDRDAARLATRAQMSLDWKSQWQRRPLTLLLGAVGVGVAASALLARAGVADNWRQLLSSAAAGGVWSRIWKELLAVISGAAHQQHAEAEPADEEIDDSEE